MPGIYSQDHYIIREGIVRILKMAIEAPVSQEWLVKNGHCFVNCLHLPVEDV